MKLMKWQYRTVIAQSIKPNELNRRTRWTTNQVLGLTLAQRGKKTHACIRGMPCGTVLREKEKGVLHRVPPLLMLYYY
jgi:hypothetical protein